MSSRFGSSTDVAPHVNPRIAFGVAVLLTFATILAEIGCGGGSQSQGQAQFRIANGTFGSLTVYLNEKTFANNIPGFSTTAYLTLPAGKATLSLNASPGPPFPPTIQLTANTPTTALITYGTQGSPGLVMLTDDQTPAANSQAKLRIV
jgi:hypothetical protein